MRSIDIHAHITPEACLEAMVTKKGWHCLSSEQIGRRFNNYTPRGMWNPEDRIKDMDSLGEMFMYSQHIRFFMRTNATPKMCLSWIRNVMTMYLN